ncbi:MAG: glycosyltransferase family 39 protein [Phycisphaerae bacterium]|nr:glycosyltransferase family 39 protein [Phycisphaerae bacterium]
MKERPGRFNLPAVLALCVCVLGVVGLTAWRAWFDPAIPFLSEKLPAEWIVYPTPWQLTARQVKERRVRFRKTFALPARPQEGRLRLRAFRGYCLWINDKLVGGAEDLAGGWKDVQEHTVGDLLAPGENRIEVEVRHVTGPPALWLVLQADGTTIKTDPTWEAQTERSDWKPVRLATEPMRHPITRTSPSVAEGWKSVGYVVALWACVAVVLTVIGGYWAWRRTRRRTDADEVPAERDMPRSAERILLGLVAVAWVALCANNVYRLPPVAGFDAPAHMDYITFLQTHKRLPLASDGWEMYQPPLYYVLSATGAAIGRAAGWADAETSVPKLISMISGLAEVILVWLVLRIVFPDSARTRCAGLLLAAAMPMNLFMSQYPSNELLSVALVTGALVLALRIIRGDRAGWRAYALLGVVLGLAMLAKHTAFLALVVILTVLAARAVLDGAGPRRSGLVGVGEVVLAVFVVSGWFGIRNWIHFRNPLVGNWDPVSGNAWWQDPGVGTWDYYTRFGGSLTEPFHSCLYSYGDAIYSTIWGDGMCAGIADTRFRPPWHYDLMAVGFSLSWLPTLLIAIGLIAAVVRWVRAPASSWAVLVGHALLVGFAVFYMTLKLPYYAQAKGFYGLTSMACLCALGAWGFDLARRGLGRVGVILWVPLLVWALNGYASYFVWPRDAQTHCDLGEVFAFQGKPERGIAHFREALERDPSMVIAYDRLGGLYSNLGRYADARRAWEEGLRRDEGKLDMLNNLAWLLATCPDASVRDGASALKGARRLCEATRGENPIALDALAAAQAEVGKFDDALRTIEQAIPLAQAQGLGNLVDGMTQRAALYRLGKPYHQPAK